MKAATYILSKWSDSIITSPKSEKPAVRNLHEWLRDEWGLVDKGANKWAVLGVKEAVLTLHPDMTL